MSKPHQDRPSPGNSIDLLHEKLSSEQLVQFETRPEAYGPRILIPPPPDESSPADRAWRTRWGDSNPIDVNRELWRGRLALFSISLLFLLVLVPIIAVPVAIYFGEPGTTAEDISTPMRDLLSILLPPVSGIVGAAIAYYYGTRPEGGRPEGTRPEDTRLGR